MKHMSMLNHNDTYNYLPIHQCSREFRGKFKLRPRNCVTKVGRCEQDGHFVPILLTVGVKYDVIRLKLYFIE